MASLWPTRVLGGLSEVRVEHISCGPFHAAAVSASGHLFTWGDGSFGKLGHGDHVTCYSPRPVEAVGDMWVISLSCGWWHTAMAAVPRSSMPSLPPGGSLSRQSSSSSGGVYQQADSLRRSSSSGGMLDRSPSPGLLFGGHLFTWGGDFSWSEPGGKVDHHQGCLGHGDLQGRCLPTKVKGEDDVCAVACGQNFTIALTTTGYVLQMGKTGANPDKQKEAYHSTWEGALVPVVVAGIVSTLHVDRIAAGMNHVAVAGTPRSALNGSWGRPAGAGGGSGGGVTGEGPSMRIMTWGKGQLGQLGTARPRWNSGGRLWQQDLWDKVLADHATPVLVGALDGRRVLHITAGANFTLAVCEHDPQEALARSYATGGTSYDANSSTSSVSRAPLASSATNRLLPSAAVVLRASGAAAVAAAGALPKAMTAPAAAAAAGAAALLGGPSRSGLAPTRSQDRVRWDGEAERLLRDKGLLQRRSDQGRSGPPSTSSSPANAPPAAVSRSLNQSFNKSFNTGGPSLISWLDRPADAAAAGAGGGRGHKHGWGVAEESLSLRAASEKDMWSLQQSHAGRRSGDAAVSNAAAAAGRAATSRQLRSTGRDGSSSTLSSVTTRSAKSARALPPQGPSLGAAGGASSSSRGLGWGSSSAAAAAGVGAGMDIARTSLSSDVTSSTNTSAAPTRTPSSIQLRPGAGDGSSKADRTQDELARQLRYWHDKALNYEEQLLRRMQEVHGLKQQLSNARHASAAAAASAANSTLPPPGASAARGGSSRRNLPLGLSLDSKLAAAVAAAGRVAAEGGGAGGSGGVGVDTDALGASYALSQASDGSGDWQSVASGSPERLQDKLPGVTGWEPEPVPGDGPAAPPAAAEGVDGEQRVKPGGGGGSRRMSRTASEQLAAAGAFNTREGAQAAAAAAAASGGGGTGPVSQSQQQQQQQQQMLMPWTAEQQSELDQLRRLNQQLQTQIQALQQQHQQQQQQPLPLSSSPPPSSTAASAPAPGAAAAAVLHRHRLQSALGLQRTGSGGMVGGGLPGRHQRAISVDLGAFQAGGGAETREVEPGVWLTLAPLPAGPGGEPAYELRKVHLCRQRFAQHEKDAWWAHNRGRILAAAHVVSTVHLPTDTPANAAATSSSSSSAGPSQSAAGAGGGSSGPASAAAAAAAGGSSSGGGSGQRPAAAAAAAGPPGLNISRTFTLSPLGGGGVGGGLGSPRLARQISSAAVLQRSLLGGGGGGAASSSTSYHQQRQQQQQEEEDGDQEGRAESSSRGSEAGGFDPRRTKSSSGGGGGSSGGGARHARAPSTAALVAAAAEMIAAEQQRVTVPALAALFDHAPEPEPGSESELPLAVTGGSHYHTQSVTYAEEDFLGPDGSGSEAVTSSTNVDAGGEAGGDAAAAAVKGGGAGGGEGGTSSSSRQGTRPPSGLNSPTAAAAGASKWPGHSRSSSRLGLGLGRGHSPDPEGGSLEAAAAGESELSDGARSADESAVSPASTSGGAPSRRPSRKPGLLSLWAKGSQQP